MSYKVTTGGVEADGTWLLYARDTETPDITYRLQLTPADQQLLLLRFEVQSSGRKPRDLQSADLRKVRLHSLLTTARSYAIEVARDVTADPKAPPVATVAVAPATAAFTPRRGRPALPSEHYERVARRYLELLAQGHTRGILQMLADEEDRPVQTVRTWINVARSDRYRYLTPGESGRAGALPGPGLPPTTARRPKRRTR